MNKKLLILGNKGMQGHMSELYFSKKEDYDVKGINRNHIDLEDTVNALSYIKDIDTDIILNCSGILNQDKDNDRQYKVNTILPQELAKYCNESNKKLIHISTNCVFENYGPHNDTDKPNAIDIYGYSKGLGEINDNNNLTIRTSIIGPEIKQNGIGLMHQYIMKDNFTQGYTNVNWNGVTTLELCKFIDSCIKDNKTGLINYYTRDSINKFDLLSIINEEFKVRDISPKVNIAQHQSILKGNNYSMKPYKTQMKELKDVIKENSNLYDKRYSKC